MHFNATDCEVFGIFVNVSLQRSYSLSSAHFSSLLSRIVVVSFWFPLAHRISPRSRFHLGVEEVKLDSGIERSLWGSFGTKLSEWERLASNGEIVYLSFLQNSLRLGSCTRI